MSPALHLFPGSPAPTRGLGAVLALALVGFAGAVLASLAGAPSPPAPRQETSGIAVFRLTAGVVSAVPDGATARTGDRIQLTFDARAPHGVIWSVDSRGVRSLHFPSAPCDSTALGTGSGRPLAFSWQLDDAPGAERFYFATSSRPLDPARVMAKRPAKATFTLRKRP